MSDSDSDDELFRAARAKAAAAQASKAESSPIAAPAAAPAADASPPGSPMSPPEPAAKAVAPATPASAKKPAGKRPIGAPPKKDAAGKTVVEVVSYEMFDAMRTYQGEVEKVSKYSKKWVRRYLTLCDRDIGYAEAEGLPAKHTINVGTAVRGAETGKDPLSIVVTGIDHKDRSPAVLVFRALHEEDFELWFLRLRQCISHYDNVDMYREGAPLYNPRTGLAFVTIPPKHLNVFAPLERLVLHFFEGVTLRTTVAGKTVEKPMVCFLGDLCLYLSELNADIKRCVMMHDIRKVLTFQNTGEKDMLMGIACSLPEYDMCFTIEAEAGERLSQMLLVMHEHFGTKLARTKLKRDKMGKEALLTSQLSTDPAEGFTLRIQLPMSQKYLKKMIADGVAKGALRIAKVVRKLNSAPPKATDGLKPPGDDKIAAAITTGDATADEASEGRDGDAGPGGASAPKDVNPLEAHVGSPRANLRKIVLTDSDDDKKNGGPASPLASMAAAKAGPASPGAGPAGPVRTAASIEPGSTGLGAAVPPAASDRMYQLLSHVGVPQYHAVLAGRGVDWEVFSCMDALDLKKHGVTDVDHQMRIENALNDTGLMYRLKAEAESAGRSAGSFGGAAFAAPNVTVLPAPSSPDGAPRMFIDDDDL